MAKVKTDVKNVQADQGERMYEVTIELTEENQPDEFISVNERNWKIRPGETVILPECAVAQLNHKRDMTIKKLKYMQSVAKRPN